jgi:hypothetical protein
MRDIYADSFPDSLFKLLPTAIRSKLTAIFNTKRDYYELSGFAAGRTLQNDGLKKHLLSLQRNRQPFPDNYKVTQEVHGYNCVPIPMPPEYHGNLSNDNLFELNLAFDVAHDLLPPFIKILLGEYGVASKLAEFLTDIDPIYATTKCRGQKIFFKNTYGVFNPYQNYVGLSAKYLFNKSGQEVIEVAEIEEEEASVQFHTLVDVLLHEYGHFITRLLFNLHHFLYYAEEHQKDFVKAYRKDTENLKGATETSCGRLDLKYYLTKDFGGSQDEEADACDELFAELFAEKYADNHCILQRTFPLTFQVFEKMMKSLQWKVETRYPSIFIPNFEIPTLSEAIPCQVDHNLRPC